MRKVWLLLAAVLLLSASLATPAQAAEIPDAINNITVTTTEQQNLFNGTVGFDMDWCVPDGSSADDFFTLTLPPELKVPNSFTFDLTDAAGNVVAVATTNNGVLTFTLTSFVEGRNNVCGTAFVEASIDAENAVPDSTNDLVFSTASQDFMGTVDVGPVGDFSASRKFAFALADPTAAGNDITSGIETRALTAADVGTTVTFTDTPGPGTELDCSTTRSSIRDAAGDEVGTIPAGGFTETCTPSGSMVTFVVTPDMVDMRVRIVWDMNITDPSLATFTNDAIIDIGENETTADSATVQNLNGGGTGTGDIFDLALFKQLADGTNLATVAPGDTVTFTLTIENQGTVDATNIEVVDYLPASLTLADSNWTDNGDGTASLNAPIAALATGTSSTVDIIFTVDADASGTIDNFAEISGALDGDGELVPDVDSTPDALDDDLFVTDDDVTGDGINGGDEDDHDRAQLNVVPPPPAPLFDLALVKQLADGTNLATVTPSSTVTFTIEVFNQGTSQATDIVVTDYHPVGLTLSDPAWIDNGDGTATSPSIPGPLAPGASTTLDITFVIDANVTGQLNNWAEIASADDDGDPTTPAPTDIDSTPDADPANDNQPTGPNDVTDDEITESGLAGGDEDDHDVAGINVVPAPLFDLALFKQLADGTNLATVTPGSTVTFTLTLENQGNVDAANVEVVDYHPTGLTLADPNWTDNGDNTVTLNTPIPALAAGTSTTVDITFTVNPDAAGTLDNFAEIAGATDSAGNPATDIDSTPDALDDDVFVTDDDVTGDGINGGDEDDHDRAQLNVVPALVFEEVLAFTGAGTNIMVVLSLMMVLFGAVFVNRSRRMTVD